MPLSIRPAHPAEHDTVVAIWQACGLTRPWNDPLRDIALCVASPEAELLVALDGDDLVGTAMTGHDGHRGWMYYVGVRPDRQGTGVGRALVDACEAWLRGRDCPKAMLMIRGENTRVRGFYESLGYVEEDRVVMSRWLRSAE